MPISLLLLVAHQFHVEKWGFLEESESEGWRKVRVSKHYKNICEYHKRAVDMSMTYLTL